MRATGVCARPSAAACAPSISLSARHPGEGGELRLVGDAEVLGDRRVGVGGGERNEEGGERVFPPEPAAFARDGPSGEREGEAEAALELVGGGVACALAADGWA